MPETSEVGCAFLMDATDPERPADPGSPEPSLPELGSFALSDDHADPVDLDEARVDDDGLLASSPAQGRAGTGPGDEDPGDPEPVDLEPVDLMRVGLIPGEAHGGEVPAQERALDQRSYAVDPIAGSEGIDGIDGIDGEPAVVAPAVVLVMVAHDPGSWFEETLAGVASQDYPNLTVLVVDNGSFANPTELVAAILPDAFVIRLAETLPFAQAVNQGAHSVEGSTFLLVCHDDVVLGPGAVRLLVEEAFRSNAAVVGPKLVDFDRPEILLEVGLSIDKFAVPWSAIEEGEVDQEQHDAVRDVFFVPAAAMLMRADLFSELGGMDPKLHHRAADADLCWRTRLMGGRVIVAPDAFARHLGASSRGPGSRRSVNAQKYRSRLRMLLKVSSPLSLLAILPQYLVLSVLAVLRLAVVGRFGEAAARIGAVSWNVRNLKGTLRLRRIVQRQRHVPDRELRALQVRSTARLRSLVTSRFADESRVRVFDNLRRGVATSASSGVREPVVAVFLLLVAMVGLGARNLISGSIPAVGSLTPWPGAGASFDTFASPWRFTGLGASVPAAPAFGLMGLLTGMLGDHPGLARTVLVVAVIPVGALGAFRLGRALSASPWPAIAAAVTYAALSRQPERHRQRPPRCHRVVRGGAVPRRAGHQGRRGGALRGTGIRRRSAA